MCDTSPPFGADTKQPSWLVGTGCITPDTTTKPQSPCKLVLGQQAASHQDGNRSPTKRAALQGGQIRGGGQKTHLKDTIALRHQIDRFRWQKKNTKQGSTSSRAAGFIDFDRISKRQKLDREHYIRTSPSPLQKEEKTNRGPSKPQPIISARHAFHVQSLSPTLCAWSQNASLVCCH